MTLENFKRAQEITDQLARIGEAIKSIERVNTSDENRSFCFGDDLSARHFGPELIDPLAKEGCKALLLANLNGKAKQLEAEFEKL